MKSVNKLKSLVLSETKIRDSDLTGLFHNLRRLQELSLDSTRITDKSLKLLQSLPLKKLDLANTEITDSGLKYLESIKTLKLVLLHETKVTQAGVQKLRSKLPQAKIHYQILPQFSFPPRRGATGISSGIGIVIALVIVLLIVPVVTI